MRDPWEVTKENFYRSNPISDNELRYNYLKSGDSDLVVVFAEDVRQGAEILIGKKLDRFLDKEILKNIK